eukprot:TRINITY_DN60900_c0_g1_i1.p1 TRINITY_DN60900_c0_g1~~TRINITY_DN60900_c0_g1_i1.p1  ORF type:complete len:919 (+),score=145.91 TRINITY_DN60900_c0_g1_i1:96-2852(+)
MAPGKVTTCADSPDIEGFDGPPPVDPSRLKEGGLVTRLLPPTSPQERAADEARSARTPTQQAARELWNRSCQARASGDLEAYVSLAVEAVLLDEKGCQMKSFQKDGREVCEPALLVAAQHELAHASGKALAGIHALCGMLLVASEPARALKHLDDGVAAAPMERVFWLRSALRAVCAKSNDGLLQKSLDDLYAARDKAPRTAEGDKRRRTYGHCASKLLFALRRETDAICELQDFIDSARDSDDEYERSQLSKALYESVPHMQRHARKNFDRAEEVQATLPQHLRGNVTQERAMASMMLNISSVAGTGHMGAVERFRVGEVVLVTGLTRTEYNGLQGTVKAVRDDGRREVILENGKAFAVKVSNLEDPGASQIEKSKAKMEREAKKTAAESADTNVAAEFNKTMTSIHKTVLDTLHQNLPNNPVWAKPGDSTTAYANRLLSQLRETTDLDKNAADPMGNGDQSDLALPDTTGIKAGSANFQDMLEQMHNTPYQRLRTLWSEGFDFNPEREADFSPMMVACFRGHLQVVRQLLDGTDAGSSSRAELLNIRESVMRMSPLLGTISGSRVRQGEHVEVAKLLLEAKADVHAKDVAGFSVLHHCCTIYASETSLQLARLCAQHGADPNTMNRLGELPLSEPVMNRKHGIVRVLCEIGADPTRQNRSGSSGYSMAALQPEMMKVFSEAMKVLSFSDGAEVTLHGLVKAELNGCQGVVKTHLLTGRLQVSLADGRTLALKPENLKATEQRACAACGVNRSELKECSGCREVAYCSQACQKGHWKAHKSQCQQAGGKAKTAEVAIDPSRPKPTGIPLFGGSSRAPAMTPSSKGASGFIVKVQVPIADGLPAFMNGGGGDAALLVYNHKRSIDVFVGPDQEPAFTTLSMKVRSEGVNGCKGYFNARLAEDGLVYVNSAKVLPPQTW